MGGVLGRCLDGTEDRSTRRAPRLGPSRPWSAAAGLRCRPAAATLTCMDKLSRHSAFRRAAGLACAALLLAGQVPARAQAAEHWVGSWAAAPQPAFPGPQENYTGRTLRLVVHASIGGGRWRIR